MTIRKLAWAFLNELDDNLLSFAVRGEDFMWDAYEKHKEPLEGKVPPEMISFVWEMQKQTYNSMIYAVREALMHTFFGEHVDFDNDTEEDLNYDYFVRNPDSGHVKSAGSGKIPENLSDNSDELASDDEEDDLTHSSGQAKITIFVPHQSEGGEDE